VNVQEYISSGIIESYVLGLASPEEQLEFESMSRQHPEVEAARIAFELSLEQQAMANAVQPPADMKQKIQAAVVGGQQEARVIPLDATHSRHTNWIKYAAAASIILLVGSIIWNISLINRNKQLQNNYEGTVAKLNDTQSRLSSFESEVNKLVGNPNVKMAAMKGLEASPSSVATVYWDSTSKDVYLTVNNLPQPPSDQQYQLWAILNGKPIDVGLIANEYFIGEKKLLLRMKNVSGAQAFAITLEHKGGSDTPKGKMYVLGNL